MARGLAVDSFAPRLSFFWDVHNDFFEEMVDETAALAVTPRWYNTLTIVTSMNAASPPIAS